MNEYSDNETIVTLLTWINYNLTGDWKWHQQQEEEEEEEEEEDWTAAIEGDDDFAAVVASIRWKW